MCIRDRDWTKVNKDGVEGFVKNQAVEVGGEYTSAISMEEEAQREAELQRALEEERLAAEAAAEQTEAPAEQTEAAAEETEAPAEQTEAPAEETEAPVEETEAPAEETEAPEEQAGSESTLYIEDVSETVWTTDAVNVRANADSSSSRVGGLGKGASITRTGICDNGWSRVDYDGTTAYIHSDYLTTTEPVKEEPKMCIRDRR